jgi:hypothetical protein
MFDNILFTAWIAHIFWAIWYANIQFYRLNKVYFAKAATAARNDINNSSGIFRYLGQIMYSPYLAPTHSLLAWAISMTVLIIIGRMKSGNG